jgi:2-keto-4-pentenoate hydratase/2-oxohepta-3-ene-1,7-dioic acid hydratase in catechol pathway
MAIRGRSLYNIQEQTEKESGSVFCFISAKKQYGLTNMNRRIFQMKLYTIMLKNTELICVQEDNGRLYRLSDMGLDYKDMNELIENITEQEKELIKTFDAANSMTSYSADEVKVCAPIQPNHDVICLGVNYKEHIDETSHIEDFQNKQAAVYFSKRVSLASGSGDIIPNYDFVDSLDYEVELGVILGKTLKNCTLAEAAAAIFGYTVINDVSARNLQFRHKQWFRGKSLDGYTPIGPCIVTADEIDDVQSLGITCRVNGELRQNSNTRLMITPVIEAITELSHGMTLEAGTVIATGTPGGVAMGMKPPVYLKSGDVVECEIENIGKLINIVG